MLTPEEFEILNKGPGFVPTISKVDEFDIMVESEYLLTKMKIEENEMKDVAFDVKKKTFDLVNIEL